MSPFPNLQSTDATDSVQTTESQKLRLADCCKLHRGIRTPGQSSSQLRPPLVVGLEALRPCSLIRMLRVLSAELARGAECSMRPVWLLAHGPPAALNDEDPNLGSSQQSWIFLFVLTIVIPSSYLNGETAKPTYGLWAMAST